MSEQTDDSQLRFFRKKILQQKTLSILNYFWLMPILPCLTKFSFPSTARKQRAKRTKNDWADVNLLIVLFPCVSGQKQHQNQLG